MSGRANPVLVGISGHCYRNEREGTYFLSPESKAIR